MVNASNLLLNAYTLDELAVTVDAQRLIGLINRMRLFAPHDVVTGAEAVMRSIIEISLKPSIELRQLARSLYRRASIRIRCWRLVRCAEPTWTTYI